MISYLDIAGTYSGPGAYDYNVASYPGGAILFVNSATGVDNRGRIKFPGGASQSGVLSPGTQGPTGDPNSPLASVFGANGALTFCKAGRGDVVVVAPGHAENITATSVVIIPGGVTIIGGGYGSARPTFTFTSNVTVSPGAAGSQIQNCIFDLTGVSGLTAGFTVAQSGFQLLMCRIRQASVTNQATVAVLLQTGADDFMLNSCDLDATEAAITAGIGVSIPATNTAKRPALINNMIHGNWATSALSVLGTATEANISYSNIRNLSSAGTCINSLANITGMLYYCTMTTGAATTAGFTTGTAPATLAFVQVFGFDQNATMTGKNAALFPAAGTN